jgi:hypothetical protein
MGHSWCLLHTKAAPNISARSPGSARPVPLDSLEASTRCLTAWARSDESTGFPEARRLHPSSHDLPIVALAPLPERIIESHQACYYRRAAVTETAGRVGRRRAGWRGIPALFGQVGEGSPWKSSPRRPGGKTGFAADAPRSCTHNFPSISARRIEFYCENIPKKPSAVANSLEINRGDFRRAIGSLPASTLRGGLDAEINLEISKCIE